MSRTTFLNLLAVLNCHEKEFMGGKYPVCVEKQLLMTLWLLEKEEVILSIADQFNVTVSTVFNCASYRNIRQNYRVKKPVHCMAYRK